MSFKENVMNLNGSKKRRTKVSKKKIRRTITALDKRKPDVMACLVSEGDNPCVYTVKTILKDIVRTLKLDEVETLTSAHEEKAACTLRLIR